MSDPPVSRGFRGRPRAEHRDRVPPGQHVVEDFPVLSAGPTPTPDFARWRFALVQGGDTLGVWDWAQFNALPQTDVTVDIHCVTAWSKLDTRWRGVTVDTLLAAAGVDDPPAPYVLVHSEGGYTTNVPAEDLLDGKAMVATQFAGEALHPEHGGPARLLVPHLYFWKSAKWVRRLNSSILSSPASGRKTAITSTAIPGASSAMRATEGGAGAPSRLRWMTAAVRDVIIETPRVRSLVLDVPDWPGHRAGQHVDVRLTAEDGYQAQRSYSIASPPEADHVMLTVERLEGGEVSAYLAGDLRVGDTFELRGPIGGYFVWTRDLGGPLFLVAGGSGIVPLMAMLRHRAGAEERAPATLLYSSRSSDDIIYRDELEVLAAHDDGLGVVHTLTRAPPPGWKGFARRIDRDMLVSVGYAVTARPRVFVCGPNGLVEAVARELRDLGHAPDRIKTERFGPTG